MIDTSESCEVAIEVVRVDHVPFHYWRQVCAGTAGEIAVLHNVDLAATVFDLAILESVSRCHDK
jgi:hypothetical protein